jgi:hypothetical protein
MAVNHADGQLFGSIPLYPIAAGVGAAQAGAGWFTILFVPAGLALGIAACFAGRGLVYSITGFAFHHCSKIRNGVLQGIAFTPFFILYLLLPAAINTMGVLGMWAGCFWLVRHF